MTRAYPLVLLAVVAFSCVSPATDTEPEQSNAEVRALIEELAARFPPAHETGFHDLNEFFGLGHRDDPRERDAERVSAARDRLKEMGPVAFPDLVACSDDTRYSFSRVVAAWVNHSVGQACFEIIAEQIDHVPGRSGYKDNPEYIYHVSRTIGLKKWWARNKHRALRDLQIESVRWTIAQEKARGFPDDARRRQVLVPLEKRLDELCRSEPPK